MSDEHEQWEHAMLKHADGRPVPRAAARQSLETARRALSAAGGRPPIGPDGETMVWNEHRGWHAQSQQLRGVGGRSRGGDRLTLREAHARQRRVECEIRQARVDREIGDERELLRSASPLAWRWARMFRTGMYDPPGIFSPEHVKVGFRLARRGFDAPPDWLRREHPGNRALAAYIAAAAGSTR